MGDKNITFGSIPLHFWKNNTSQGVNQNQKQKIDWPLLKFGSDKNSLRTNTSQGTTTPSANDELREDHRLLTDPEVVKAAKKDPHIRKTIQEGQQEQKRFAEIEKKKDTIKASNGMTYNQIRKRLNEIVNYNWGGVVKDKKTGKPRFPYLSEIIEHLKHLANTPSSMQSYYQNLLKEVTSLVNAKKELETKHPEFVNEEYTTIIDARTGEKRFMPGKIDSRIDK